MSRDLRRRFLAEVTNMLRSVPDAPIVCLQLVPLPGEKYELNWTGAASPMDMIGFAFELLSEAKAAMEKSDHPSCDYCIAVEQAANAGLAALAPFGASGAGDGIGDPKGTA